MTLQEAKSIARHLGLTLRLLRSGKYRVNFLDGNEARDTYSSRDEQMFGANGLERLAARGDLALAKAVYRVELLR